MTDAVLPTLLYDADQAAAILRCKPDWLKRQARKGKVPAKRQGRSYVWTPALIKQIIDGLDEVQPAAPRSRSRSTAVARQDTSEPELRARPPQRKRSAA